MGFDGKRVLSLESRRASETAELIRRNGGVATVAPSMQEAPIEANEDAIRFAEKLFAGEFDMVVFLTGVGTRYLAKAIATRWPETAFADALSKVTVVARGPKPVAALRELGVPVTITVPEPNTWRELLEAIRDRPERRIAVQLYGRPHPELVGALEERGARVMAVPVYAYQMPDDLKPLQDAANSLVNDAFDVTMFTTSNQVVNLLRVARDMGIEDRVLAGLRKSKIASIGPTTTEMLHEFGLQPDLEPTHPKLGILVKEAAELL
jgi:uroporphyrinogen-III synthase